MPSLDERRTIPHCDIRSNGPAITAMCGTGVTTAVVRTAKPFWNVGHRSSEGMALEPAMITTRAIFFLAVCALTLIDMRPSAAETY